MNDNHLSREVLGKLKQQRDENRNLYIPIPTDKKRTLLLIGPTRAGKSTIVKTLQDSLYEPPKPTLFSGTRLPEDQQIAGLRIIDMPGFNDLQMTSGTPSLSNKLVLKMLQDELNKIEFIHIVAFVFSLSNGIKQEDINTMVYVQSNVSHLSERMVLVITHAEELNSEEQNRLIKEFFDHPLVKQHDLRRFFKRGILFIGCLRYESLNQQNYQALFHEHQNILEMRKRFIEKCFEDYPFHDNQRDIRSYPALQFIRPLGFTIGICTVLGFIYRFLIMNNQADQRTKLLEQIIQRLEIQSNDITTTRDLLLFDIFLGMTLKKKF